MNILSGWKTVIFGLALSLTAIFSSADLQAFVGLHFEWFGAAAGAIVIVLRAITTSPIFAKPNDGSD